MMAPNNSFYIYRKNQSPIFKPNAAKFQYTLKNLEFANKSNSWHYLSFFKMIIVVNNSKLIKRHDGYFRHRSAMRYMSPTKVKFTISHALLANGFANWCKLSFTQMRLTIKNIDFVTFWNLKNDNSWEGLNFAQMRQALRTHNHTS